MLVLASQYLLESLPDEVFVIAHDGGCAQLHGNGPFGILSQRQAGDAQATGLFLDAARVGQHQLGLFLQAERIQVIHRFHQMKIGGRRVAKRFRSASSCGDGPGKRTEFFGTGLQTGASKRESVPGSSTLEGRCRVSSAYCTRLDSQAGGGLPLEGFWLHPDERVDHDISHQAHFFIRYAFLLQVQHP